MPRPLPDAAAAAARAERITMIGEHLFGQDFVRPMAREMVARGLTVGTLDSARKSLLRWLGRSTEPLRVAPDHVMAQFENWVKRGRDTWIVGEGSDTGDVYVVRQTAPRFIAAVAGGQIGAVTWIDPEPPAVTKGGLLREALAASEDAAP